MTAEPRGGRVEVRPLCSEDVDPADRVLRRAFTAMLGSDHQGDADVVGVRTGAPHISALGAFAGEGIVGAVFAARWGSLGVVGPLAVAPPWWGRGIGSMLFGAADTALGAEITHRGLFTFAHSPRHQALYQRFGYWPRFLTVLMSRQVGGPDRHDSAPRARVPFGLTRMTELPEHAGVVAGCDRLTGTWHPGLSVAGEIALVLDRKLGEVLVLGPVDEPVAFAVVHDGPGSEAGTGVSYVKFAAAAFGDAFDALVDACLDHARDAGAARLVLGVSTARHRAYRHLVERGFVADVTGVRMHAPNAAAYDREDAFVVDDWR